MTNEELNSLEKLYSKFTEECERVGKIISKVYWDITSDYEEAPDCSTLSIYGDTVYGRGTDKCGDLAYCEFPAKYLTMSDSELTDMINKMNADYLEEKHRKEEEEKRKKEEATIKRELAELKRLKEKYEQGE
jgi:hypothetical protein